MKATGRQPSAKRSVPEEADPILSALTSMDEEKLTSAVVIPLVEVLHPGRIEYTHSTNEAGRDIVSFGRDSLGRPHILCVQIKARPISYGAREIGEVQQVSTTAKLQGVTSEDGRVCIPHEVWYLTSHPFPETSRRQVANILQDLELKNIKFIGGEEFSTLVREKIPKITSALIANVHPHLVDFLSVLSKHTDGRAFGLMFDRQIHEFYVTSAISCSVASARTVLDKDLEFSDLREVKEVPLLTLIHEDELSLSQERIRKLLLARVPLQASKISLGGIVPEVHFDLAAVLKKVIVYSGKAAADTGLSSKQGSPLDHSETIDALKQRLAKLRIRIQFEHKVIDVIGALAGKARKLIDDCPKLLADSSPALRETILAVRQLDDAVKRAIQLNAIPRELVDDATSERAEVVRVKIPHPEQLLDLFKILLIDGPAGCGKTTLLKTLAVRLANKGRGVVYVSCAEFELSDKELPMLELVEKYGCAAKGKPISCSETVLIVDALDESAFNVSEKIEGAGRSFANVVVSCRTAYATTLRSLYPMIALSPFNNEEREEFFEKWFSSRPDLLKRARELVTAYKDLDLHTRLPLIATVLVALLENGDEPKTRADIYGMRLELLLSRWDRSRGVKRLAVDKPEPKRRFLRQLAFELHSSPGRLRLVGTAGLEDVYEASLGKWGYSTSFERVLGDLVEGSGLLIEERKGVYSFGHLSFQEHLAGEHLANSSKVEEVAAKYGDDWWREPLNFYACIKGDITELASVLLDENEFPGEQLAEMISYAPYTSPGLVDSFKAALTEGELDASSD